MSQQSEVFFELVPENYTEETVDNSSQVLDEFCERALGEGFTKDIVDKAREIGSKCKSYEEFADVINEALNQMDDAERRAEQRKRDIQRSIQRSITQLKGQDVLNLIDRRIEQVYKTTSITSLELTEECAKTFTQEMSSIYGKVYYAVYLCFESAWVKQAFEVCIDRWDTSMDVKNYIAAYLKSKGATDDNINSNIRKLPEYLPETYKNETSPLQYMAYKSVQLITQKGTDNDIDNSPILQSPKYYKTLEHFYKKGVPLKAACTMATYAACRDLKIKASYGYTVMLQYANSVSFSEAYSKATAPLADLLVEPVEAEVTAKEEKLERDIKAQQVEKQKVHVTVNEQKQPRPQVKTNKKQVKKVDIAPYIPKWFAATFIHIVICLVLFIFTKFFAILSGIALGAASVGWYSQENGVSVGGKSPYLYMVLGYVGFIGCLILYVS